LKRLFLVPPGRSAADGIYVNAPFEALLAVTVLASNATQCIVIGEDLGTVPEGFRATMSNWGVWSYQVMLFERSAKGNFVPADKYRKDALATFATHDLPTFAGWLHGDDLKLRRSLRLASGETREQRRSAQQALRNVLGVSAGEQTDFAAVAKFLGNAPARLVMVSLEDLIALRDQINVPGTTKEYPNWRRRLRVYLEELAAQPLVRRVADVMRVAGRSLVGQ
jgi:4-alpha-glucanotransferase